MPHCSLKIESHLYDIGVKNVKKILKYKNNKKISSIESKRIEDKLNSLVL
jgi:hypothetical protein